MSDSWNIHRIEEKLNYYLKKLAYIKRYHRLGEWESQLYESDGFFFDIAAISDRLKEETFQAETEPINQLRAKQGNLFDESLTSALRQAGFEVRRLPADQESSRVK